MQSNYWHRYYEASVLAQGDQLRREMEITSTGERIHLDVYPHPTTNAPVVIFNHGAAGYCRLFVPLALGFYRRGYTVILPDQRSQGLSTGQRGDYTINECVQNIVDVATWAREQFAGPLFMAGGSVGGALTYYAAATGAPVEAIVCLNLFDFSNGADGLSISRFAALACYPVVVRAFKMFMALARPIHRLRIPFNWIGAFDKLMDERDREFQTQWDADPIPPRLVSLRALASNMTTAPVIPFEQNQIPTLVINQSRDKMVDVNVTKRNYERLGGPKCYLEIPFGHWSSQPKFWETVIQASDEWFRSDAPRHSTTQKENRIC